MLLGWPLETWQKWRSPQSEVDMTDCVERTKRQRVEWMCCITLEKVGCVPRALRVFIGKALREALRSLKKSLDLGWH